MKKITSVIGVSFFTIFGFIIFMNISNTIYTQSSFHEKGLPSALIKRIFGHLGVSVKTIEQANDFAQKNLLRTGERWDVQVQTQLHKEMHKNQEALMQDLDRLGMLQKVEPTQKEFTYALVMGSLKKSYLDRLDSLTDLFDAGYTFNSIVLLGGERQLRDIERDNLPESIHTEAQMMEYLCKENPKLSHKKLLLINAPMITKADGSLTRPTTDSTLEYFAQTAPEDGSCLVISHNPYIIRQTKVAQRILDQKRFPTQGAGRAFDNRSLDIVMLMDEFARTLYEECKKLQKAQ